jgi:hypothetical protein
MKNWQNLDNGTLMTGNYRYDVLKNEITGKYKLVFTGLRNWNKNVKVVRYYPTAPKNENICLTVRSL